MNSQESSQDSQSFELFKKQIIELGYMTNDDFKSVKKRKRSNSPDISNKDERTLLSNREDKHIIITNDKQIKETKMENYDVSENSKKSDDNNNQQDLYRPAILANAGNNYRIFANRARSILAGAQARCYQSY